MSPEILRAVLTIALGALAGGVTNTVAVWMLFHPYEPPRIGRWRLGILHGAVPKNQARLAHAVGRTVGGKLLTADDFQRILGRSEFREAFDERLDRALGSLLEEERGSLRELLPEAAVPQVERLLCEVADIAVARFSDYLDTDEFQRQVEGRARDFVTAVADDPVGALITPAREEALAGAVDGWLEELATSEGLRQALEDYLERAAGRILEPGRTFEEILPAGLTASLERAVGSYLPLVIQRLGGLLEDPVARARFEGAIHDLLQRFLRDLRFHQRVVARLIVTESTVERVLDAVEEEGAESLSEMLRDPAIQDAMAQGINHAVVDLLEKPVTSVLGEKGSESVVQARTVVRDWALDVARDPATRSFLVEKVRDVLAGTADHTWGELFQRLPPETVASWLVAGARSEAARGLYREAAERVAMGVLDRPIGRPDRWLPDGTRQRLHEEIADPLWEWLQGHVPRLVERVDVAGRVEEKILHFPTPEIESLVRRVTERELRLIIRLGYLLGAVIGVVLVAVHALVG